jgi:hypothetical protein
MQVNVWHYWDFKQKIIACNLPDFKSVTVIVHAEFLVIYTRKRLYPCEIQVHICYRLTRLWALLVEQLNGSHVLYEVVYSV